MSDDTYKTVTPYPVTEYRCGARAGDQVRLCSKVIRHDHAGAPTGEVHPVGEIWDVLPGAAKEPIVVWLRQADGETHTSSDDDDFLRTFEMLPRQPSNQAMQRTAGRTAF